MLFYTKKYMKKHHTIVDNNSLKISKIGYYNNR
jgi:hypothetical protein